MNNEEQIQSLLRQIRDLQREMVEKYSVQSEESAKYRLEVKESNNNAQKKASRLIYGFYFAVLTLLVAIALYPHLFPSNCSCPRTTSSNSEMLTH